MTRPDIQDDDASVGRLLSRREVMALLGTAGAGAALLVACGSDATPATTADASSAGTTAVNDATGSTAPADTGSVAATALSCVARPEQTEGPYFVDEKLNRSDVRSDPTTGAVSAGVPLTLTFNVSGIASGACAALAGASIDIWHCDGLGVYSDVRDTAIGFNTVGQKFLRGYQVTDAAGKAQFTTIVPGWYQGRAVHIHFKIRTTSGNRTRDFTSQLYFEDALLDAVYTQAPYSTKSGKRIANSSDGIYNQGGAQLLLKPVKSGNGYAASFDLGLTS